MAAVKAEKSEKDEIADAKKETTSSFEESLEALEAIVARLEQGELPLEEAMTAYEAGVKLTAGLNHKIKDARLKIEELKGQQS